MVEILKVNIGVEIGNYEWRELDLKILQLQTREETMDSNRNLILILVMAMNKMLVTFIKKTIELLSLISVKYNVWEDTDDFEKKLTCSQIYLMTALSIFLVIIMDGEIGALCHGNILVYGLKTNPDYT